MRLALKLVSVLVLAVVALLIVEGYVGMRRENASFETDLERDAHRVGVALRVVAGDAWRSGDSARMLDLMQRVTQSEGNLAVEWLLLDELATKRREVFQRPEDVSPLRRGEERHLRAADPSGTATMWSYIPVELEGGWQAAIELRQPMTLVETHAHRALIRTGILTAAVAATGALLIWILGMTWVGRPLRKLSAHAQRVAAGDLSSTVDLGTKDELGLLASELNAMCEQLRDGREALRTEMAARVAAVEELRHADRLRMVGQLAAGVAHELGTPLNIVLGHASMIAKGHLGAEEVVESAEVAQHEVRRMAGIVRQLLDFARRRPPKKSLESLPQLAAIVVDTLQPIAHEHRGQLELAPPGEPIEAHVDPNQLQQVLSNLVVNALQAGREGTRVEVSVLRCEEEPPSGYPGSSRSCARIDVCDDGVGIAEGDVPHIFEPFFTTKQPDEGTGLGLSIAQGLVHDHDGWIAVVSQAREGTCFSVFLPPGEKP